MPVCIPDTLPAAKILASENIPVVSRAEISRQDIRPLHIAVLNLMPTKEATEAQLLRLLGSTPQYVQVSFLRTATYESQNTSPEHMKTFYCTFDEIRNEYFDGLIITGAPVEHMDFHDVQYWCELVRVMDWAKENTRSTLFICWAAQAALYHFYGIEKHPLPEKMFGVFPHRVLDRSCPLVRGFEDEFSIPVSRHTAVDEAAVHACSDLHVIAASDESGIGLMVSRDNRFVFATGHSEYDAETLANEYFRDVNKGLEIAVPKNYFPDDDPAESPTAYWHTHARLLFGNWIKHFVYQENYILNTLQ